MEQRKFGFVVCLFGIEVLLAAWYYARVFFHENKTFYQDKPPQTRSGAFSKRKSLGSNASAWRFLQVPDENLEDYFLPEEIQSGLRDSQSGIGNCPNRSYCCISTYSRGGTFEYYDQVHPVNDTARKMDLWTLFKPYEREEPQSLADALNVLIIRQMSKRKKFNKDEGNSRPPHLLFFGDSLMEQTYHFLLCSLERSLGVEVVRTEDMELEAQEHFTIPVGIWNEVPMWNKRAIISLQTPRYGIQEVHISYIKQHRIFVDPVSKLPSHAPLLTSCGVSASISNGTRTIYSPKIVDVIMLNHGVRMFESANVYHPPSKYT
jgi:hypothetical protein